MEGYSDMTHAQAFIDDCNAIGAALARRASPAPAAAPVNAIVYRRVWPTSESVGWMGDGPRTPARCDSWLDSSLALRDGLSVVEIFMPEGVDASMAH